MFAAHVGAGLAIGWIERRVNVSVFIAAALSALTLLVICALAWQFEKLPLTRNPWP